MALMLSGRPSGAMKVLPSTRTSCSAAAGAARPRRSRRRVIRSPLRLRSTTAWTHLPEGEYRIVNPLLNFRISRNFRYSFLPAAGVGLLALLAFRRRGHAATPRPPGAGCRRLRTIGEADHGANPSAGLREDHALN